MGYQNAVVIFLDVMGTRENKEFESKLLIHKLFHGEAKTNEKRNHDHVIYDRKVYSFSDCAYVIYYYKDGIDESRKDDAKLFNIALYNTSLSILRIVNSGFLIRGGATFGQVYFDELGFFGPAIEEAYEMESKKALYPRVIVNKKWGREITKLSEKGDNELYKFIYNSTPELCILDSDDQYYLNFFYSLETMNTLILEHDTLDLESVKSIALKTALDNMEKHKDDIGDPNGKTVSIYEKNKWFAKYVNSREDKRNPNVGAGSFSIIG